MRLMLGLKIVGAKPRSASGALPSEKKMARQ